MNRVKKHTTVILLIIVIFTLVIPTQAIAASIGDHELSSQGALVMDFETGHVLFSYEPNVQRPPASMIKILSAYVAYDAVKAGELSLDTVTLVSAGASALSSDDTWSNVPLPEGYAITIRELLDVIMIRSACGATVVLAEAVSGSEAAFMERMVGKAAELGVEVTVYDSWGGSPYNRISPLGLAILTRALISDYPEVLEVTKKPRITFRGVTYNSTNLILYDYPGVDGFKTGYTSPAGYCFIGTALRDGRRIITITMGSTISSRYPDTIAMLDFGFKFADRIIDEYNRSKRAAPSSASLMLNGEPRPIAAYLIDNEHYFMLRDLAYLLSDTEKRFDITSYDAATRTVLMESGVPYSSIRGDEMSAFSDYKQYSPSKCEIFLDGGLCTSTVYMIDGSNFFRFRDIGILLDFFIDWEAETRTVIIDTSTGYVYNQ